VDGRVVGEGWGVDRTHGRQGTRPVTGMRYPAAVAVEEGTRRGLWTGPFWIKNMWGKNSLHPTLERRALGVGAGEIPARRAPRVLRWIGDSGASGDPEPVGRNGMCSAVQKKKQKKYIAARHKKKLQKNKPK